MRRVILFFIGSASLALSQDGPVEVTIAPDGGLLRGGRTYLIKGAGGELHLDELARRGGNSVRTWSERDLAGTLEQADKLGLTVCAGIWLENEGPWFSYAKPEHCARQLDRVKQTILKYRMHPALLLWGIGNECEGDGENKSYWQQLNRLARMVHQEDPAHPTFTAVAGLSPQKASGLSGHTPDLDLVGINTYAGLNSLREHLAKIGWTRPWLLTEFGPRGFWESPMTPWHAPKEQTSTQKAAMIRQGYQKTIAPGGACAGSYVFLWGQKQEATSTWFGVFTKSGETTATADVMQELWTGQMPSNRAPELKSLECSATALKPSQEFTAEVAASDPDGDQLQVHWEITDDARRRGSDGREIAPAAIEGLVQPDGATARIKAPHEAGAYRVFVYVLDGKGHAATANVPVQVSH